VVLFLMHHRMDDFKIDSHKLGFHPRRIADWLEGQTIYPIYVEISPSGACNHRCSFCAFDFMKYQDRFLATEMLLDKLTEMHRLGIKSVHFAGEGEPLLHKSIADIVKHAAEEGIDVGMSTNGVLLDAPLAEKLLPYCTWIKFSIGAGKKETYAKLHGCREGDFDRVISNLREAVLTRRSVSLTNDWCTLGAQMLLLPENESEIYELAEKAHGSGIDYIVFKPYSQHPKNGKRYEAFSKLDWRRKLSHVAFLETKNFKVIIRSNAFDRATENRKPYDRCLALPFWCYIDAGGSVWGCYNYIGDERFYYGNIYQSTFEEIWNSRPRRECWKSFDVSKCRMNCRMDETNRYLWGLKHPGAHVNFI